MPIELKMLVWSVALTILQMLIAALGAQMQVGLPPLAGISAAESAWQRLYGSAR